MKKTILFIFLLILGIILFIITIKDIGLQTIIETISHFKLGAFLLFLLVSFINHCFASLRWKIIIKTLQKDVSMIRMIFHTFAGFAVSYLTPSALLGGEPVRIYLLKQQEHISAKEGAFSVVVDKALELTSITIFIFVSMMIALSEGFLGKDSLSAMVISTCITIGIITLFYYLTITGKGFFSTIFRMLQMHRFKKLKPLEDKTVAMEAKITSFFIHEKKTLIITFCMSLLIWLMRMLETFVILYFLHVSLSFTTLFIISYLPLIALLMPVPGGLGVLEGGTAAVMALLGLDVHIAISLVLITRIRDILWVGIGLAHTSHHSIRNLLRGMRSE